MSSIHRAAWTLVLAFVSSGCGVATSAGADYQAGLDFGRFETFDWDESAIRRGGDVRLENSPFFEDALFDAIQQELANRGIRRAETSPQLLVHYHLSVQDHIEVYEANPESNYPNSEFGGGTTVVQYEEGVFVVHFVDASRDEDLWIGWARGNIGPAMADAGEMRTWVGQAVARMFEDFPVTTGEGARSPNDGR